MDGLRIKMHPVLDLLCREDGAVLLPKGWSFGTRNRDGYRMVSLREQASGKKKFYYVHRLICEAFHKNHLGKPTVDHIDRNPGNNFVKNLRWATQSEQNENSSIVLNAADYGVRYKEDPNAYKKAWAKAHPDSRRESLKRYAEKKRQQRSEQSKN